MKIIKKRPSPGMKLVCKCGNEMEFNNIDEDTGKEHEFDEHYEAYYVTKDTSKFGFWSEHDECGFECKKCGHAVWLFT